MVGWQVIVQTEGISAARHDGLGWWRGVGVLFRSVLFTASAAVLCWLPNVTVFRRGSSIVVLQWRGSRGGSISRGRRSIAYTLVVVVAGCVVLVHTPKCS